jgi:ABC-type lipoprotein export system ATPase subunit
VSDNSLDDFSSAGQDVANASGLCRQLVRNLKSVRFGLIVGPHGSGKTTLLYNLVPYLVDAFEGGWNSAGSAGPVDDAAGE